MLEFFTLYLLFVVLISLFGALVLLKSRGKFFRFSAAVIFLLIFLPGVIGYFYLSYFASFPTVEVPDLSNVPLELASTKLEILGLRGRHAGQVFDQSFSQGVVISQKPAAGSKVKVGRVINLVTSAGAKRVIVPNLVGRPLDQASEVLLATGLLLGEKTAEVVKDFQPGIVLSQDPLPDTEVDLGTAVAVTISASLESGQDNGKFSGSQEPDDNSGAKGGLRLW